MKYQIKCSLCAEKIPCRDIFDGLRLSRKHDCSSPDAAYRKPKFSLIVTELPPEPRPCHNPSSTC